ncbi:MAG: bifunctional fucokinase/L-fucose-1-P-guanylyltransferase [Prevotella sp.]|nr:bifunctional fucokinase/L-fucose-1-P-guanylyltransferase [Prevotella sp.]
MKKLLSLPPNLVRKGTTGATVFHDITGLSAEEYFCTCDPAGHRVGSGGGTAWLLWQAFAHSQQMAQNSSVSSPSSVDIFSRWLSSERRILLHAGGQSRRLPAYAPSGKILTPIPVFRWERGQRLGQDLLSLQLPLYERIMHAAPKGLNTMVVSGDVFIRLADGHPLPPVPEADVVCYGLWLDASVARNHGVFISDRHTPQVLKQMLQKPSTDRLKELQRNHFYLTDIGVWLLSDRAVHLLMKKCIVPKSLTPNPSPKGEAEESGVRLYDLYSDFGRALGTDPELDDPELRQLSVAVVPLTGGEFYHFGTSTDVIASMVRLQNVVSDQRRIMHFDRKPHPSIFVQNATVAIGFNEQNANIWIENSYIGPRWTLTNNNIVTGVPQNDWQVALAPGECLDIVPIGEDHYAVRRYHIDDRFDGAEQQRPQFPVVKLEEIEAVLTSHHSPLTPHPSLSAEQISAEANLHRLFAQREAFRRQNWPALAANWQHSVFYQLDLDDAANCFHRAGIPLPPPLTDEAPLTTRIHDVMLHADSDKAFGLLRQGIIAQIEEEKQDARLAVCHDQIVWARSPVRIDIAGGWTDTPPYCMLEGGNVVNLAIDLNGQQPLQAYVRPCVDHHIVIRSIDLGATETISNYDELVQYNRVGSPFSIPKAALALSGFAPQFAARRFDSLQQQLEEFGAGIELTLLSAIPAGSGLGTSSILAATVLAALSDFCALGWDKNEIGRRTLALEQLLTTGGGWQDQLGGVLAGVKLLQSQPGINQQPMARWLPTDVYTLPEYRPCHLLYYTGITRTAKQILAEIVRRMFLNSHVQLLLLRQMKEHALQMYEAIQCQDYHRMGRLVGQTWLQNQQLDSGTNPVAVKRLTDMVDDLCLGYKLPGAGGGGYLYMVAKDTEAAARIKHILNENRQNANARFVDMALSTTGLQVSRS